MQQSSPAVAAPKASARISKPAWSSRATWSTSSTTASAPARVTADGGGDLAGEVLVEAAVEGHDQDVAPGVDLHAPVVEGHARASAR